MNTQKNKTYRIAILGILSAFIIIQTFVPFLGNIPIPPLNPTIIHITVIVAAFVLSTKDGMLVGLVWGLARMVKAYTLPASPLDLLLWTNPVIAVVPRVMVGLVAGLVFHAFLKRKQEKVGMVTAAVLGSLTNTVLVLGFIALFYGNEYATALNVDPSNLLKVLAGIVATNGIGEAVAAGLISPFIATALMKVRRK
ncbi:MAG: ECF transporter S component [Trichococcus flocculiformis]|uniref:ECF transporter S component n=1 Tax=Trichococcus flocculiformis TaxID=82803 RepID=A0A847D315_9LACT|nr:ECF transporter S component [Trichococcus flocculiformis]NLD31080.1 ECF transporter S component [Trichococcus flocculiformis]